MTDPVIHVKPSLPRTPILTRISATRILKNAKAIRKAAPHIIPAQEPLEGFHSLVPLDILKRFDRMSEADLAEYPELLKVKQQLQPPSATSLQPLLFGDPPFKGTLHFVRMTFFMEGSHTTIDVSNEDVTAAIQYATLAAVPISAYAAQYGSNRLEVSPDILQFGISVTNTFYNDDTLQGWVNSILDQYHLDSGSSCIVILNPLGMTNTDGDRKQGIGGYHDEANAPYCFVNLYGVDLTVQDRQDYYADVLSHEVAEMTCDPDASFFNHEVCDGCAGNCNNSWRNFFLEPSPSPANSYIQSSMDFPPAFPYTYFIASIATRPHADDCPAPSNACAYGPPIHVGRSELLFYDRNAGVGEFYSVDGQAEIGIQFNHSDWRKTWSVILQGNFSAKPNPAASSLLFYSPSETTGEFYQADGSGQLSLLGSSQTNWRGDWTHIVPGKFSDNVFDDLLFYESATGTGEFRGTDGHGNVPLIGSNSGWRTDWSLIIPGHFSDSLYTDLLFYEPATGTGEFWRTDGRGNISLIRSNTDWRTDWSLIIPGHFSDSPYTDLLFYEPSTGTGEFRSTDGLGNVPLIGSNSGWRTDWSLIIPGNFSGGIFTDLLFYESSTGTGEFRSTDGHGNVPLITNYNNWRTTWAAMLQP